MKRFGSWLAAGGTGAPRFISDNSGFDWQFVNWYFHHFTGARSVPDLARVRLDHGQIVSIDGGRSPLRPRG
jgi:hypothetical protein